MPTSSEMKLPIPNSPDEFENICHDYLEIEYPDEDVHRYGRLGQSQNGIDIYIDNFQILVQCKRYYKSNANELIKKIQNDYNSAIAKWNNATKYIIMTTFSRDVKVQDYVSNMGTNVDVVFWEEIEARICETPRLIKKYYPSLLTITIPQKYATFLTSVEAFISFEDRNKINILRQHYETAKETGYLISHYSENKKVILQIITTLDELFADIRPLAKIKRI